MSKKGVVSRADLLAVMSDHKSMEWVADQLHLVSDLESDILKLPRLELPALDDLQQPPLLEQPVTPAERPALRFWYLRERNSEKLNDEPSTSPPAFTEQHQQALESDWNNRPTNPPKPIPLLDATALLARLNPFLKRIAPSRKVDTHKMVKTLSQGKLLKQVPRKNRKYKRHHLHIIDDRSHHLTPYRTDHDFTKSVLFHHYQGENISFSVLMAGDDQPQQYTQEGFKDWSCPSQSVVLVLSDLGALQQNSYRRTQAWKKLGQQLNHQQCQVLALIPCSSESLSSCLTQWFKALEWDHHYSLIELNDIQRLLTHLAPAIRIEPSLLRQMRIALGYDSAIESAIWQHTAIPERHSVAASWDSHARKQYLKRFEALSDDEKQKALTIIRAWRQPLDKQIWYEECVSLAESTQILPLIQADVEQAKAYFKALQTKFEQETTQSNTAAWCRRLLKRIPDYGLDQSPALQNIAQQVQQDNTSYDTKNINPQNLPLSSEAKTQAVLYQRGQTLFFQTYQPFDLPEQGYSHVALIQCRRLTLQVKQGDDTLTTLELDSSKGISLTGKTNLTIKSDLETLYLDTHPYSEDIPMGRDMYGLFMDVDCLGVIQRFRYIEPSVFMMGSPENEKERRDNEDYHQVKLTQGYWLADTTCTQALWQVVMGKNSSSFKDDLQNPVERVSWLDVQDFLAKLNQVIPHLKAHLPTEAQWENACRAGTITPFFFGENISSDLVNYNGNYPYANGKKGEYQRKTVPVKALPMNQWGLYQMHGNVWEWCLDEYQNDLGAEPDFDPVNASFKSGVKPDNVSIKTGFSSANSSATLENSPIYDSTMLENADEDDVLRVLRGGSWDSRGWFCYSAFRLRDVASHRYNLIGFRIALGRELQSSQVLRSYQDQHRGSDSAENTSEQAEPKPSRNRAAQALGQAESGDLD